MGSQSRAWLSDYHFPIFLPRKYHEERSLASYSPQGGKESDVTEQLIHMTTDWDSLVAQMVKSLPAMWETWVRSKRCGFDPWVGMIPCSRKWQPVPVFLPGKSHGQRRSLVGYSPWGCKESDMTEWLHFHHWLENQKKNSDSLSNIVNILLLKDFLTFIVRQIFQ